MTADVQHPSPIVRAPQPALVHHCREAVGTVSFSTGSSRYLKEGLQDNVGKLLGQGEDNCRKDDLQQKK